MSSYDGTAIQYEVGPQEISMTYAMSWDKSWIFRLEIHVRKVTNLKRKKFPTEQLTANDRRPKTNKTCVSNSIYISRISSLKTWPLFIKLLAQTMIGWQIICTCAILENSSSKLKDADKSKQMKWWFISLFVKIV